jgi:hypothetical protein
MDRKRNNVDPLQIDPFIDENSLDHHHPFKKGKDVAFRKVALRVAFLLDCDRGIRVCDADEQVTAPLQGLLGIFPVPFVERLEAPVDHAVLNLPPSGLIEANVSHGCLLIYIYRKLLLR